MNGAHLPDNDHPLTGPHLFGGFAFRSDFTPDNTWSIYSPAYFVLPHYQMVSIAGETWLTINTQIPLEENPADLLADLQSALRDKIAELKAGECSLADQELSKLRQHRISYELRNVAGDDHESDPPHPLRRIE